MSGFVASTATTYGVTSGVTSGITSTATAGTATAGTAYVQFTTASGGMSTCVDSCSSDIIVTRDATPEDVLRGKKVAIDFPTKLSLRDGTIIDIKSNGNFVVNDKDAKVIYKGNNIREFNKFINASDILEQFIIFLGKEYHVKQDQILQVPIELFINWLIMKASEEDGDSYIQEMKSLDSGIKKSKYVNRCKYCGRFITKKLYEAGINFCDLQHHQLRLNSLGS